MARSVLQDLLRRQPAARAVVSGLAEALGTAVAIQDAEGRLLHGHNEIGGSERFPIVHQDTSLGWVAGPAQAAVLAALLDHLVAREAERKALGAEALHLYREINLIYSFSEKLAALLDLERVAELTLQEARHLIAASDGVIMLLAEENGDLTTLAGVGDELPGMPQFQRGRGIVGAIADTGVAEIVNDVASDRRRVVAETAIKALVCAPLKVGERVIGVIALGSTQPAAYTAAELKLLNTLGLQAATAIENARLFERTIQAARERERLLALQQQTEVARARLQRDLDLAARIQADLFPAALPRLEGYDLAARNRPARSCGGDYYDALPLGAAGSADTLLLCVADVAGKGLPAALVMSSMQATLRALLGRSDSLPALATRANELLYGSTSPEKYVTAALVELVPATGTLAFLGAGHLENLILRASGDTVPLASTGAPLGLLPAGPPYTQTAEALAPGDCLVLFSDGATDAENACGEEFGEARLTDVLQQAMHLPAEAMIARAFAAIDEFAGDAPQFDDITMLIVRRLG